MIKIMIEYSYKALGVPRTPAVDGRTNAKTQIIINAAIDPKTIIELFGLSKKNSESVSSTN